MTWHFLKREFWLVAAGTAALFSSGIVYLLPVRVVEASNFGTVPLWLTPVVYFALAVFMGLRELRYCTVSIIAIGSYLLSVYLYLFPIAGLSWWYQLLVPVIVVFFASDEQAQEPC